MAKLPDDTVLGPLPSAISRRPIATFDASSIAQAGERVGAAIAGGGAALAKGINNLGEGIGDAAKGYNVYQQHVDNMELERAKADALTRKAELDAEFATDKDYGTMRSRYLERMDEINADAVSTLSRPGTKERFAVWSEPRVAYADGAIQGRARAVEGDVRTADAIERLDKLRNTALANDDPVARADAIDTANGIISSLHSAGFIDTTKAVQFRQKWTADYSAAAVSMLPDDEQVRVLSAAKPEGVAGMIAPDDRKVLLEKAKLRLQHTADKLSAARSEAFERTIIDAASGNGALPERKIIEDDDTLGLQRKNAVLRQYDAATKDVAALREVAAKFADPNAGPFNPFDKKESGAVDKLFKLLGGDGVALQRVVDRTGMVPETVATSFRGDLISSDPKRVASTLQTVSNMVAQNPNVFAGNAGKKEFEDAATEFTHNVQNMGMTADQAARDYITSRTPEYQAAKDAKIKNQDINKIVKDNLTIEGLRKALDPTWWSTFLGGNSGPAVGFSPEVRQSMYNDYDKNFRDAYLENGNIEKSKSIAADKLKKVWGVTSVSGSDTLMRYPPERAPAYAGIENVTEKIAKQALDAVKEETGATIERGQLRLDPAPGGRTAAAYWAGQPPPYLLSWQDKNGLVHYLNPGRAFVADPQAMRSEQAAKRQSQFERERAVVEGQPGDELGTAPAPVPPPSRRDMRAVKPKPVKPLGGSQKLPAEYAEE